MYRAFKMASGIIIEQILRWACHVPTYKTVEPIRRLRFFFGSEVYWAIGYCLIFQFIR
jgi:hypothetical protein